MTEEQQAELLAAWLADPEAPIPEGLDPDVVEAVVALHPERAPAPRVTADAILALVEEGPLAPTVVEPPPLPEPANTGRGWWKWALAGSSGLVAAALALVVVGVGVVGSTTLSREAPMEVGRPYGADDMAGEGVAASERARIDTGVLRDDGAVARRARPSVAAAPRPSPRPAPKPAPRAALPEVRPEADAVAFAEEHEAEDFYDDGALAEPSMDLDGASSAGPMGGGAGGLTAPAQTRALAPADAAPQRETTAIEASKALAAENKAAEEARKGAAQSVIAEAERSKREGAEEDRRQAERRAAERAQAERLALEAERRAQEEQRKVDAMMAAEEAARDASSEALDMAASPAPRPRPRRAEKKAKEAAASAPAAPPPPAAEPVEAADAASAAPSDPDLANARAALTAGDPAAALNHVARGLQRHPTDSRIRQQLFQAQGDAYTALGQTDAATNAYRIAREIGARL